MHVLIIAHWESRIKNGEQYTEVTDHGDGTVRACSHFGDHLARSRDLRLRGARVRAIRDDKQTCGLAQFERECKERYLRS